MVSYRQQTGSSPGGSGNRIINPPALECLHGGRQHEETRFIHTRLLTFKKKMCVLRVSTYMSAQRIVLMTVHFSRWWTLPRWRQIACSTSEQCRALAHPSRVWSTQVSRLTAGSHVPDHCTVQVNVFRRGCRYFLLNLTQYFVWEC